MSCSSVMVLLLRIVLFLYEKAYMGVLAYYRGVRDNSYLHKWDLA